VLARRYVRLALTLVGLAFAVALAVGAVAVLLFAPVAVGQAPVTAALPVWMLLGVVFVPILVGGAIALSIVVLYAQRAIALDDLGALASLRLGWRTLRQHLGESLIAWAIAAVLGIAAGVSLFVLFLAAAAVVGGIGVGVWTLVGAHPLTFAYATVGGLAMLLAGAAAVGLANTFLWNYWTLTYMRLRGSPLPSAAAG
jgi:hypothetical protein